jgi:SAM-dependent methyltransferase
MRTSLLDILACPTCRIEAPLALTATAAEGGDVIAGELRCGSCNAVFPIRDGIPRIVREEENYCETFGYQWTRWKTLQIDRLGHHDISEERFFANSPWTREWLKGKLILDAGCGAGRFSDIAAKYGARVVSCDISAAIDACRETTRVHGDLTNQFQASIYDLPFKRHVFDGVFCYGVIQHTPDPAKTMRTLPQFLKPGAPLAYDFYEKTGWDELAVLKYRLRRFTPELTTEQNLRLAHALTAAFFPLGAALSRLPFLHVLTGVLPIAVVHDKRLSIKQEYLWTLLDTFDWYGPRYEIRQDHRQVVRLLEELGLAEVKGRWGVATARAVEQPSSAASATAASSL